MFKISHEVPIDLLEDSRSFNCYDYCLVHLLETHPKYYQFYKDSLLMGREVILDTSVFELGESFDPDRYAYWINVLKPTEYIIPDCLNDGYKTMEMYESFVSKYPYLPGKRIGVVHGKTYPEIRECYKFMAHQYSKTRPDKIAISFGYDFFKKEWNEWSEYEDDLSCLKESKVYDPEFIVSWNKFKQNVKNTNATKAAFGRIALICRMLKDKIIDVDCPHHLLGAGIPIEFKMYSQYSDIFKFIKSIDTSNPIVAGLKGIRYNVDGLYEKPTEKLVEYIDHKLSDTEYKDIMFNVNMFKKLVTK